MKKTKILAIIVLVTMIMLVCTSCAVKMAVPEVEEGRFDVSVTYEVNGEERSYTGVYVCKFKGVYSTLVGSGRKWDCYIENGDYATGILAETIDDIEIFIDFGFYPEYFMADPDYSGEKPEPTIYAQYLNNETGEIHFLGDVEEIYEQYGVKLISYQYAEPIENSYNEKVTIGSFEPSIN